MTSLPSIQRRVPVGTAVGILGAFFLMVVLVWALRYYTRPMPVDQARAEERRKFLKETSAADSEALAHYGWVDQNKGVVRLPIDEAMRMIIEGAQNPAAARSNLIARVEHATAAAPKPPEKPSEYE